MFLYVYPLFQAFDQKGLPLSGGKLYTYYAGTTTPKETYSDYDLTEERTNPIILNTRGEAGPIYGRNLFKFVLDDANDNTIWTVDNVPGIGCCSEVITFDNDDLVDGVLTIDHLWETNLLRVTVFNENDIVTIPEYIDCTSDTEIVIGFGSSTINGTWSVRYGL